jgi:hypothetical protein
MEVSKMRPKSILKTTPSPKNDTGRKGIRFSERNEIIPIPRSGQPEEVTLKSQDVMDCLDNTLRKIEKALNEMRTHDNKAGFLKSVQNHAQKLGLGTLPTITEKASAQLLEIFHEINNVKVEVLKKGTDFLFIDDFSSFKEELKCSKQVKEKAYNLVLQALYSKVSRHYQIGRLQFIKKSDLGFHLILYAYGIKLQEKAWHNQRLINAMIGNDLHFFKQELASRADLVWQLEPDDAFFSLFIGAVQFKRHQFLDYLLEKLPLQDMTIPIVKELLYAGLKLRKNLSIWKKLFEYQFHFVAKKSGLEDGDFFSWVPEGELHLSLAVSGREIIHPNQINVKTFKQGDNLLFEFSSGSKDMIEEQALFVKREEGKDKVYRKTSHDQFEEIPGLGHLQNHERAFNLVQDPAKTDGAILKNFTCTVSPDSSKRKLDVATNFFGFESSKQIATIKSLKHRTKYTSTFFRGSFNSFSPLWHQIDRPEDLVSKINSLKASPFTCLEGFRCAIDDAIENKYSSVVDRLMDPDTVNVDLQNYQKNLIIRGPRIVELTPSVWVTLDPKQQTNIGMNWQFCKKLICLTTILYPELIGAARVACGLQDSMGKEENLTNFKLKVDKDDRTEVLLISKSSLFSKRLTGPEFKLVDFQNSLPVSTMESKTLIVIPRFKGKCMVHDQGDTSSMEIHDSSVNYQARGESNQSLLMRPLVQTPTNKYLPRQSKSNSNENTNMGSTATQTSENSLANYLHMGQPDPSAHQKSKFNNQSSELLKNKFIENR